MEKNWTLVYTLDKQYKADLAKEILAEEGITAVIMNKRDSAIRNFGEFEVYVNDEFAEKAKKYGKPMTINQMTAHDRRIVHLTLKDDRSVRTQSMGDGYYRRLVIFPKRARFNKKQSNNKNQD